MKRDVNGYKADKETENQLMVDENENIDEFFGSARLNPTRLDYGPGEESKDQLREQILIISDEEEDDRDMRDD